MMEENDQTDHGENNHRYNTPSNSESSVLIDDQTKRKSLMKHVLKRTLMKLESEQTFSHSDLKKAGRGLYKLVMEMDREQEDKVLVSENNKVFFEKEWISAQIRMLLMKEKENEIVPLKPASQPTNNVVSSLEAELSAVKFELELKKKQMHDTAKENEQQKQQIFNLRSQLQDSVQLANQRRKQELESTLTKLQRVESEKKELDTKLATLLYDKDSLERRHLAQLQLLILYFASQINNHTKTISMLTAALREEQLSNHHHLQSLPSSPKFLLPSDSHDIERDLKRQRKNNSQSITHFLPPPTTMDHHLSPNNATVATATTTTSTSTPLYSSTITTTTSTTSTTTSTSTTSTNHLPTSHMMNDSFTEDKQVE